MGFISVTKENMEKKKLDKYVFSSIISITKGKYEDKNMGQIQVCLNHIHNWEAVKIEKAQNCGLFPCPP